MPQRVSEPMARAADQGTRRGGSKPGTLPVKKWSSRPHESAGEDNANESADAGEEDALPEELGEDGALGCADGFEDADFAGALGDRDEHDVDDADGAEAQGDDADAAEKDVHGVEDGADHVLFLDGVPLFKGVFEGGVEAVVRPMT